MSYFFLDSSALVKRYLTETGTLWVDTLTDPSAGNTIVVAEITLVEVAAALAARHRAGAITLEERDEAVDLLHEHYDAEYRITPVSREILDRAVSLTQNHRLRGYDAVQLATALTTNNSLAEADLPELTLVAADEDLVSAARAEGLTSDDPNRHP
ncbi:MAG: type II toxin-antitoxin system VapC family toxin [Gammaproteobacteria bacterium]